MASLSELIDYAHAKQPRNPLAEIAGHFIEGAGQGYDAGLKAKANSYEQILKSAQALKAQEEARTAKITNDNMEAFLNQAKMTGASPLTAGETVNGKTVVQNEMGAQPSPVTGIARLAAMFAPPPGMKATKSTVKLPGNLGSVEFSAPTAAKPARPANPLNQEKEDRIVWDKATARALKMAQNDNPMATFEDSKKYLRVAFSSLGKNPDDYLKNSPLMQPPPANNDPFGLLKTTPVAGAQ